MTAKPPAPAPADAAEALAALAHSLIARTPDDAAFALESVAAIRAEVDRLLRAAPAGRDPSALAAELRPGLAAAGLGALAPPGAGSPAIQAGLARLHGLLATMVVARAKRR